MVDFLAFISRAALESIVEKPIFGKQFVRVGRLFIQLGCFVYQQGGLLGYSLGDKPILLGKLVAPSHVANANRQGIVEYIRGLSQQVAIDLEEAKNDERTFLRLYTMGELSKIGIDLKNKPYDKKLEDKVDPKFTSKTVSMSFNKGISLGMNYPKEFSTYWEHSYGIRSDTEWNFMRMHGLNIPEKQEAFTLDEAIAEIAENALRWGNNLSPNIFDNHDISVLGTLIASGSKR